MAYTQDTRMCQVSSPLGDDVLLLAQLNAHEAISSPFFYDLELMSERDDIDFAAVIGKPMAVHLTLANGNERYFNGIVSRFSQGPAADRFTSYHAEVVPWIWLLRRRAGCRIYQHKTVPDIIKALLAETGFGDVEFQLSGDFPEREYCVQYRETDLNFISRLAEEEGIAYFFKHTDKQHTLVFFNSPSAAAPCPGQASAHYASQVDEVAPGGSLSDFRVEHELATGKYALTDYNFEDPSMSLLATTTSSTTLGGNDKFEVYDHPGEYLQLSEGERRVKLRMQAEEAAAIRIHGQSDCAAFVPGYRFDLQGHYRGDYNTSYLITEVTHQVMQDVGDAGTGSSYTNTLACLPHSVPMRPLQRTPRPLITGVQTATVVGASGKEIDVDAHGRVVVQFHWDREGGRNENSSCRIRVSQNWAGKNWGMISNPRIGQEVIVEFIEGDPDRPIVTGRVYNGEQTVPYDLPANATQTGIKTRSSLEGAAANFNEIRFEDKKGEEQLFIHAEKNQDIEVENDETQSIGHNRTESVGNDEKITITANRTESVGKDESITIEKNRTESVGENEIVSIGKDQTIDVTANRRLSVGKDERTSISEKRIEEVGTDEEVTISKNRTHSVGEKDSLSVGKDLVIDAGDSISLTTGDASITLKKDGTILISGKDIKLDGSGKIDVKASSDVTIKGSTVKQN